MNDIRENSKNIKKEFVKSKFIDAAKSIIFREGVTSVTARRIAEITGYSYATIYHYFKDMNALLLESKLSMIQDMLTFSDTQVFNTGDPLERIKQQARQTVNFFIDNPNIFEFFYHYKLDEKNAEAMRSLELEKANYEDFMPFVESGAIRKEDIPAISRTLIYMFFGSITIYLSNNGLTREEVFKDIDNAFDILLKGKSENENK